MSNQPHKFNWSNFLDIATELSGRADEASLRSAISRAYYAAYNIACDLSETLKVPKYDNVQGSHQVVWNNYQASRSKNLRKAGVDGDRLRQRRTRADYHSSFKTISQDALDSVQDAQKIVTALESELNSHKAT
jgi:hypothetical protein